MRRIALATALLATALLATALLATALLATAALAAPPVASAATEDYFSIRAAPGPGLSKSERTFVRRFGSPRAPRVLVMVPGIFGGSGTFTLAAREIVRRVPHLQVWAWDRRTQGLEDTRIFAEGDPARAFD